jgi:hypothetical protein
LNDDCLISETQRLVQRERELLTVILHHLREIERRRLFGTYSSLTTYVVGALGYSEDQAYRRIAAMRLLKDLPKIEKQLNSGAINLTQVGLAHSLFKAEKLNGQPMSPVEKAKVFDAIAGQSKRETQQTLRTFTGAAPKAPDRITPLGEGRNLVSGEMSDQTLRKVERLRGLLAHIDPNLSFGDLVDQACDIAIADLDPARAPARKVSAISKAAIRRQIWARDGGACVNCGSRFALEEDHVRPAAMGGAYTLENMRLLCRSCNQRAAVAQFGPGKMEPYLHPRRRG